MRSDDARELRVHEVDHVVGAAQAQFDTLRLLRPVQSRSVTSPPVAPTNAQVKPTNSAVRAP